MKKTKFWKYIFDIAFWIVSYWQREKNGNGNKIFLLKKYILTFYIFIIKTEKLFNTSVDFIKNLIFFTLNMKYYMN